MASKVKDNKVNFKGKTVNIGIDMMSCLKRMNLSEGIEALKA